MARKSGHSEEPDIPPSVDKPTGMALLKKQIEKAKNLLAADLDDWSDHTAWNNTTRDFLIKTFGSKSPNVDAVIHASSSVPMHMGMSDYAMKGYKRSLIENQIKMLDSCLEQLETDIELEEKQNKSESSGIKAKPKEASLLSGRIFIVHGLNLGFKEAVARAVTKLGLTPVILHEQPNMGRTLIEKFEDYADVGFAIVLLTADDLGKTKTDEALIPRARQNVILELGYFLGRLGRKRVCALYEQGVQIPTDYDGVVYVELDLAERWKFDLVKELKAAGYGVDANKLFA